MKVQMTSLTSNQNCGVALLTKEKHCVYITLWGITYETPNLCHTHYGFAYYNTTETTYVFMTLLSCRSFPFEPSYTDSE